MIQVRMDAISSSLGREISTRPAEKDTDTLQRAILIYEESFGESGLISM